MKKLFTKTIKELNELPENPKTFWYVSAGKDFRSLVFLTDYNIERLKKHNNKDFVKPDIFLFNGMGREVRDLRRQLKLNREAVLYNDKDTILIGKNFREFGLDKSEKEYAINPDHIDLNSVKSFPQPGSEAFYFEVEVIGKGRHRYVETQKVLYIEHENIDVFNKVILEEYFDIKYLCATREGTAFGGCNKSIVDYIYNGKNQEFFMNKWFAPEYCILFNDRTRHEFEKQTAHSDLIEFDKAYHYYLPEAKPYDPMWNDSLIYKLKYDFQKLNNYEKLCEERINKMIENL